MKKDKVKQKIKSILKKTSDNNFDFINYSNSSYLAKEFSQENKDLFELLVDKEINNNIDNILVFEKQIKKGLKEIHSIKINTNCSQKNFYNYHFNNNSQFNISLYCKPRSHHIYGHFALSDFIYITYYIDLDLYLNTKKISDLSQYYQEFGLFDAFSKNKTLSLNKSIKEYLTSEAFMGKKINIKLESFQSLCLFFVPLTLGLDKLKSKNHILYEKLEQKNLLNLSKKESNEIQKFFDIEKEIETLKDGILIYNNNLISNKSKT